MKKLPPAFSSGLRRLAVVAVVALLVGCNGKVAPAPEKPAAEAPALRFSAREGRVLNEFFRQGPSAAHLVITSGREPRLVVAFPAGNSGTALWLETSSAPLEWQSDVRIEAASRESMHGVRAELSATGGPVIVKQAIASSVRVIRGYEDDDSVPAEILVAPTVSGNHIEWARKRLDGAPGYSLAIDVVSGTVRGGPSGPIELSAGQDGQLKLRVTALTGDPPLTPIDEADLLNANAAADARLRHSLTFLSYDEKLLAGSWRFNTYFGRDTLMSLRLLAPALQPRAMEAGLSAVIERLNAAGEVAHEEDIGEFAVLRRRQAGAPSSDAPILDYKMIDDDFMLSIVAAHYLLDMPSGRDRAGAFLERKTTNGETYGARLASNFRFVVDSASRFAREPVWRNLVALKAGQKVGNWRDSEDGLGGGSFAYDVNGVFVPAALEAIGRLQSSGLLTKYLDSEASTTVSHASEMIEVWRREAPKLFDVSVAPKQARDAVRAYSQKIGLGPAQAPEALVSEGLRFRAVALDGQGRPVPILNSDEAFALLFLNPDPAEVQRIAATLTRPFPAGALTDVGLVVANPVYAPQALQQRFDRNHYHGAVVWSWQQAMFAAGLERQLARQDLPSAVRESLVQSRDRLRAVFRAAESIRGSELWSWSVADGRYRLEPFGQREQDVTESNAAQLWSTIYLALPRE